ncbi:midnolin-like [Melanotaenia boesemani]|uniref:midnolin-like n=1 Tax=Melanotaenia boesemani TaxID=1250792 RepID=UPI001C05C853|nr:midnolin-like [Melanotaenia boesemani]
MEQQHHQGFCRFSHSLSADGAGGSTSQPMMRLCITSTTGSPVELTVPRGETAEGLKTRISQKLRLQTDRIVLLHKNRHLVIGKLMEQGVTDGSKLTLVPVIESGLACPTARERTMRGVLESLTEVQINDFLSGRSPLTLSIGTGAPMMYVQLQLSAQQDVKELQQDRDSKALSSCQLQTGPLTSGTVSQPDSASTLTSTGPATSQIFSPAQLSTDSSSFVQCHTQKPRSSSHSSSCAPPVTCHSPSFLGPAHKPPSPSGLPHCSSPLQANTPVCSGRPFGYSPRPSSPASASTFSERDVTAKQPGAVIESFVSHSPGVFSGTFSGTLAPSRQDGVNNPRHGITIILQILQDLLRAAYHHQGAPTSPPPLCCSPPNHPTSQVTSEEQCKAKSRAPLTQEMEHSAGKESQVLRSSTEENKTLHCKLEHLQLLMHQRRLRRRTRRSSNLYQSARPNQQRHYCS